MISTDLGAPSYTLRLPLQLPAEGGSCALAMCIDVRAEHLPMFVHGSLYWMKSACAFFHMVCCLMSI